MFQVDKQHTGKKEHRIQMLLTALAFGCLIGFARMFAEGAPGFEATHGEYASALSTYCSGSRFFILIVLTVLGCVRKLPITRMSVVGSGAIMAIAAAVLSAETDPVLASAMAALGGAASAVAMFALIMLLSAKPLSQIVTVSLLGFVVGGAIIGALFRLGHVPGSIVLALAGFLSALFITLLDPYFDCCEDRGEFSREEFIRFPWAAAILAAISGILSSAIYGIAVSFGWYASGQANYMAMGIIMLVAIAAASFVIVKNRQWARVVWIVPLAQLFLTLCSMCASGPSLGPTALGILLSSVMTFHFIRWMLFPAFVSTSMLPRGFLNGLFLLVTNSFLSVGLGKALAAVLPEAMQTPSAVACLCALVMVVFFAAGFIVGHGRLSRLRSFALDSLASARQDDELEEAESVSQAAAQHAQENIVATEPQLPAGAQQTSEDLTMSIEDVCASLAEEYGLTPREHQIAELTARGHSSTYIAKELFISSSTVRFHQQNLYRKLDVHSKQELIVLVDSRSSKPSNSVG